jgi:hypothetical protein
MKLQVANAAQEPVIGYTKVVIDRNSLDLSSVTNNECEFILASDIMDLFAAGSAQEVTGALISKLRLNGELVVGGTELRAFASAVSNGLISLTDASNVVTNSNSLTSSVIIRDILEQQGLSIISVHVDGLHYEIKAKRV